MIWNTKFLLPWLFGSDFDRNLIRFGVLIGFNSWCFNDVGCDGDGGGNNADVGGAGDGGDGADGGDSYDDGGGGGGDGADGVAHL